MFDPSRIDPPPARILVLRSASVDIMHPALQKIHTQFPEAEIDLLCQPAFIHNFQNHALKLIPYLPGSFSTQQLESSSGRIIKEQRYDLVIMVYSNQRGDGYQNVLDFATALNPPHLIAINKHGDWLDPAQDQFQNQSWEANNRKKLQTYKDIHAGQRAFILGMGPSLQMADLDLLKNEICFACNKIYLGFNNTDWRPSYYSVIDILVAENNKEKINSIPLPSIHEMNLRPIIGNASNACYVRTMKNPGPDDDPDVQFSSDIVNGVYGGRTVLYFQLQLAFYMGIREIYLLGLDFDFKIPETSKEKTPHGETVLVHSGEKNHFHPDYRTPGERWSMPNMEVQRKAFIRARDHFEKHNGIIINASRHTKLDVFPQAQLEAIINV